MLRHPYYLAPKDEQHRDAAEKRRLEAIEFLKSLARPLGGRVLEPVGAHQ